MKKYILTIIGVLALSISGLAQRYTLEESEVKFYSDAPMEDIAAFNTESSSIIDLGSGTLAFSVPIKGFQFDKSLMQEHFNENYMESDKYPKATFSGKAQEWSSFTGEKQVTVAGKLKMHGVERMIEVTGMMNVSGDKVTIDATFDVKLEDYKIKIPKAVFYNIAEVVQVTAHFQYKPI